MIAEEKAKDRQRLSQQRLLLRRILSSSFKKTLAATSSVRASITINDGKGLASDALSAVYQDMDEDLRSLRSEKDSLVQQISDLELALTEEKADLQQMMESYDEAEGLREGLEKELASVRDELDACNAKHLADVELLRQQVASRETELHSLRETVDASKETISHMDAQLQKLKSEKKQLKTYAIQLKGEAETWTKEKEAMSVQIEKLEKEIAEQHTRHQRILQELEQKSNEDASSCVQEESKREETKYFYDSAEVVSVPPPTVPSEFFTPSSSSVCRSITTKDVDGMTASEVSLAILSSPSWSELLYLGDGDRTSLTFAGDLTPGNQRTRESTIGGATTDSLSIGSRGHSLTYRHLTAAQKLMAAHSPLGF
jgi:predicted  nucleic acid-binding Zn-ribbon protein